MKLTFSISGGFTGLSKEKSIDVNSLDEKTREALKQFFEETPPGTSRSNVMESWTLDGQKEIPVSRHELPPSLQSLYDQMKKNLSYDKS